MYSLSVQCSENRVVAGEGRGPRQWKPRGGLVFWGLFGRALTRGWRPLDSPALRDRSPPLRSVQVGQRQGRSGRRPAYVQVRDYGAACEEAERSFTPQRVFGMTVGERMGRRKAIANLRFEMGEDRHVKPTCGATAAGEGNR